MGPWVLINARWYNLSPPFSFGRFGGWRRRYPGGSECRSIFLTVSRAMPNRLAASRWLRPSTWQASRTRRHRSTVYILPPSISKKIEGYRWQRFTPPAAGKSRRFRGLICHRRSQSMISVKGASFGRFGGWRRRYPGGSECRSIFLTVSRAMPNRLAASRWLRPSTWQASRTRRYRSTVYILPPSISKKIEGYRWQRFTPPAAGKSRRFRGLICHRRSQTIRSSSTSGICGAFLAHTSTIITVQGPTCRSARTHRMDDPFSRPGPERSFPCPRSAVCIIVTNASRPDHPPLGFDQFLSVATWTLPASACPCIGSLARSGGISIVMTAPMVDYKIHWLKMMSVPESRAVVGRHDGINGRDRASVRVWP